MDRNFAVEVGILTWVIYHIVLLTKPNNIDTKYRGLTWVPMFISGKPFLPSYLEHRWKSYEKSDEIEELFRFASH